MKKEYVVARYLLEVMNPNIQKPTTSVSGQPPNIVNQGTTMPKTNITQPGAIQAGKTNRFTIKGEKARQPITYKSNIEPTGITRNKISKDLVAKGRGTSVHFPTSSG